MTKLDNSNKRIVYLNVNGLGLNTDSHTNLQL